MFKPQTGEVESGGPDTIALWMIDTDYNEESFFVRHAYFLGANDPYKALKTTLKAEIDEEAWESLYSDTSRPFPKPESGRIAVKVINHLGDEVMKVFWRNDAELTRWTSWISGKHLEGGKEMCAPPKLIARRWRVMIPYSDRRQTNL